MTIWVCTECGLSGASVSDARPSLDDRYAVGYCYRCAPSPSMAERQDVRRPIRRTTVPLIRSDLWDPAELAKRDAERRERKLLHDVGEADETGFIRGSSTPANPQGRYVTDKQREVAVQRLAELDAEAAQRHSGR